MSGPNSIKLGTNHPQVKGIQYYTNQMPGPFQRVDNHKNPKMGSGNLRIFFSRTTGPILSRLGTEHPWAKGTQNCTNEGQPPSRRGDNSKRVKIH